MSYEWKFMHVSVKYVNILYSFGNKPFGNSLLESSCNIDLFFWLVSLTGCYAM